MTRHTIHVTLCGAALLVAQAGSARGADGPEVVIRQAFQANPVIAPYNLATAYRNGRVVISGVVGTKQIHDLAIRTAIAIGYPIRDDLIIDTAAAHRVSAAQAQAVLQAQAASAAVAGTTSAGTNPALIPSLGMATGNVPYVYPPPLFGRIDDPFFGFEPPLLSYPPWWRSVAAREPAVANPNPPANVPMQNPQGAAPPPTTAGGGSLPSSPITIPLGPSPQDGVIEMTINPGGAAVLRGTVPTLADRVAIGQQIARTPGVSEVLNLLQVAVKSSPETTPPPPQPAPAPGAPVQPGPAAPQAPAQDANAPAGPSAVVVDGGPLSDRLSQAFARRPALSGLPIKVSVHEGTATLSGKVPTVYEAMLAYRVVEQTPGIREVNDRLEFVVPDGVRQNPLIQQGRPEDVEPYLTAQIRRHVGDLAHVDRIRVLGDTVEVWGSLVHADDRPRLDAILRSIAVLRGFRLEPHFSAE